MIDSNWILKFDPVHFKALGPLYGTWQASEVGGGTFSHSQPNVFYGFPTTTGLYKYILGATSFSKTLVYDFANCGIPAPYTWRSSGGTSINDEIVYAAFSNSGDQGTGIYAAVYNGNTKTCSLLNTSTGVVTSYPGGKVIGTVAIPNRFTIHNVKAKGGTYMVIVPTKCLSGPCPVAADYAWQFGTTNLNNVDGPSQVGGHWAAGCQHFLNGAGNLMTYFQVRPYSDPAAWQSIWSIAKGTCGTNVGELSCTMPADNHPAWTGDCSDTGMAYIATAVSSAKDQITHPYQNEIIGFTTSGPQVAYRFGHTYSSFLNTVRLATC